MKYLFNESLSQRFSILIGEKRVRLNPREFLLLDESDIGLAKRESYVHPELKVVSQEELDELIGKVEKKELALPFKVEVIDGISVVKQEIPVYGFKGEVIDVLYLTARPDLKGGVFESKNGFDYMNAGSSIASVLPDGSLLIDGVLSGSLTEEEKIEFENFEKEEKVIFENKEKKDSKKEEKKSQTQDVINKVLKKNK